MTLVWLSFSCIAGNRQQATVRKVFLCLTVHHQHQSNTNLFLVVNTVDSIFHLKKETGDRRQETGGKLHGDSLPQVMREHPR
ncbi:hypothetical protein [Okeania sp. SIO2C2]|uniref:hypothetical protein n=1 Tax=Okeania sp. SIO2C2 TaxID=2607787 RepID=UPI00257F09E5|nr:hypothetical protein [Okeania sp. SIO2C2]